MKVRVIKKATLEVAGLKVIGAKKSDSAKLWKEVNAKVKNAKLNVETGYGITYGFTSDGDYNYFAGYRIKDKDVIRDLGFVTIEVLAKEYAVAFLKGKAQSSIKEGYDYVINDYIPKKKYKKVKAPILEVYYPGDRTSSDYEMEVWIPIERDE